MSYTIRECDCGSGKTSDWTYDGHGIPLCRTCPDCYDKKISRYRPDIFEAYVCDEPIDPE